VRMLYSLFHGRGFVLPGVAEVKNYLGSQSLFSLLVQNQVKVNVNFPL
jgi:hypothetical protein